ncbi:MAG: ROK family protein [Prolixibacteraceae bacterium]
MMELIYLGIDIGGTNIKFTVLADDGKLLDQGEVLTEDSVTCPEIWKNKIIDLIKRKSRVFTRDNPEGVLCGISAPGLTDPENRKITCMPGRLEGLENFDWSEALKMRISVINDGHSACLAEYKSFYEGSVSNMLMLTLGTGVGGAAILNGKLFPGAIQRAGHFGHMTVDHAGVQTATQMVGSLEYAIGNFSIAERTYNHFENTRELVEAYKNKCTLATYWWLKSVQKLAISLASLINAFSPELIVLGGGITEAGDDLFLPLRKFIDLYEWKPNGYQVEIRKARFGSFAGSIGAAFYAKENFKK